MSNYPVLKLRKKEERRLQQGHLWAFSNELVDIRKDLEPGSIVRLEREADGAFVALCFYNPHSLIACRIVSRAEMELNESFFESQISRSIERRALLAKRRTGLRLVHGESDMLPGLIVDQFNDILSFQITSAGFEVRKQLIVDLLDRIVEPRVIVEKNTTSLRKLEGLPQIVQIHKGDEALTEITDSAGTRYLVDVIRGQKTGFFLDQMENRTTLRDYVREGDRCMDLFSNEGGFAINMALAGAAHVTAVDASAVALEKLRTNAELNLCSEKLLTVEADCFDYLKQASEQYDVVVLDPPALVKSKKDLPNAQRAYLQLNIESMRKTRPEGVLLTASCSHHLTRDLFLDVIREAGYRSRRTITILEERGAGIDHPLYMAMPETKYLKVFVLRVH